MTYPNHIRRVLGRPILALQCLILLAWPVSLLCNPYLQQPLDLRYALAFAALLGTSAIMCLTKRFWQWRLFGFLSVLAAGAALRLELHDMGAASVDWMLPVAVTLCLGQSILFSYSRDYLLAMVATWAILLGWQDTLVTSSADLPLLIILVAAVTLIGVTLNRTFVTAMRTTHALKEGYRRLAETDALTGIPNRRALMADLQTAASAPQLLQFAMLDIDDFKQINDQHGHHVGDAVLQALATELLRLDPRCRVGRLGGEEFGLLFEGLSQAKANDLLQRLLQRVRGLQVDGVRFAFSAGLASLSPGSEVSDLLARADRALYAAKGSGKGVIRLDTAPAPAPAAASAIAVGDATMPSTSTV
ncbi:GGDEF domain-containing protein [Xanthomonas sp. PPL139]|uniref:GGDEF domain-containing protein n=1 Tax=unclassified Xanthomonas TaxID=2643310 RepID=UPI0033BF0578